MRGGKVRSNEFFVTMDIVGESMEESERDDVEDGIEKSEVDSPKNDSSSVSDELEPHYEPPYEQFGGANRLQNILEMDLPRPKALLGHHGYDARGQGAVAGGAVAIVVVVCVGFLLVLLVVGVMKMRDGPLPKHRRMGRRMTADGMEWDDTDGIMNITINPLEDMEKASDRLSRQHSLYSEEGADEGESSEDGERWVS